MIDVAAYRVTTHTQIHDMLPYRS